VAVSVSVTVVPRGPAHPTNAEKPATAVADMNVLLLSTG